MQKKKALPQPTGETFCWLVTALQWLSFELEAEGLWKANLCWVGKLASSFSTRTATDPDYIGGQNGHIPEGNKLE